MNGLRLWLCLTIFSVLAYTIGAGAEVYQWVDAEGRTHYSDLTPDGVADVRVAVPDAGEGSPWEFISPTGERYRLEIPAGWLPLSREQLGVFEGAAAASGTPVPYQTGYYRTPGARWPPYLLVSILDDGRVSEVEMASLEPVSAQWKPRLLRKDSEAYDAVAHTLWVRRESGSTEILTASVLTERGRVALSVVTDPADVAEHAAALVGMASGLELSPGLAYRPVASGESGAGSQPLGYGVGALAGMLLVAGWVLSGRLREGRPMILGRALALVLSVGVIVALTQGQPPSVVEAASRGWLLTALVIFVALRMGASGKDAPEESPADPSEEAAPEEVGEIFAHQAARWSWIAFCLILVMGVFRSMLGSAASTFDFLSLVLALGGAVLAVIALMGMRRYGRQGILAPGLAGAGLNGLVLVIWLVNLAQP